MEDTEQNLPATTSQRAVEVIEDRQVLREIKSLPEFATLKSKQRRFLLGYSATGGITRAAKLSKVSHIAHYNWLAADEKYKQAFNKARQIVGDALEEDIIDEALNGVEHKIIKRGECIETFTQKNTILRMFALKGFKPEYRDNFQVNQFAGPVQVNVKLDAQEVGSANEET